MFRKAILRVVSIFCPTFLLLSKCDLKVSNFFTATLSKIFVASKIKTLPIYYDLSNKIDVTNENISIFN